MHQRQENQWGLVYVVLVNFNGLPHVLDCLSSLNGQTYAKREIVVVDNASRDKSPQIIQRRFPQVKFLTSPVNGGFAKGANLGIELALEQGAKAVWLLNPDATAHPQALEALVRVMAAEPKVGAVASVLRWAGQDRVQAWGGGSLSLITGRARHLIHPPTQGAPDYLCGASLLLRGKALEQVGLLTPGFPLYWEDADLSWRLRGLGGAWPWPRIRWWSIIPAPAWAITKRLGTGFTPMARCVFSPSTPAFPGCRWPLAPAPAWPGGWPRDAGRRPRVFGKAFFRQSVEGYPHDACPGPTAMKLLLWHWGRRGGGPMYTYEMAKALSGMPGLEVHLSLSRQSELWDLSQKLGLTGWSPVTYNGALSAVWSSVKLPSLRSEFSAYLRRERFDWVCGTMTHIWNQFMLRKVHQSGARYLMVLHDALLHPGERSPVRAKMLKAEVRRADAVVTLSDYVRTQAVEALGLDPKRIHVIPHGPFFYGEPKAERRAMPTGAPFRLLFFGRILAYKGLGLLIEAVRLLKKDFPGIELIVAGQGKLGAKNQAALRELGAKVINRWLQTGEVAQLIEEGDLLVAPYTSASQSGVVPLAYAHALPVVATQVGGLQEQVIAGETGLLSGPPDAASLARTIEGVIKDPELYARLSAGARDFAAQGIAWPSLAKQLVKVMKQT